MINVIGIEEITDFIMENTTYTNKQSVLDCIAGHMLYGTFSLIEDDKGISAYCRWNFTTTDTVHILDLIIRKDVRRSGLMRDVIVDGLAKFPKSEYIVFERGYDDGLQNKKMKKYKISDFTKRRFLGC